ncbi:SPFH domain-containing protein [Actinoplanes sp. NPDC049118]|uniref:SPFH domain-containing protein n=1 Tax=Actinoplanes sp. NPDC049118 TaxID=3155769 RepID=UPI0033EB1249
MGADLPGYELRPPIRSGTVTHSFLETLAEYGASPALLNELSAVATDEAVATPPSHPRRGARSPEFLRGLTGFVDVPDRFVGIVRRRRSRGGSPPNALAPRTRCWLNPLRYIVRYVPQVHVPAGTIGLVDARAGAARSPEHPGRRVEGADHFQDGAAFLDGGGERGRQLAHLPGGAYYSINPDLFEVITVDRPELLARHGLTRDDLREVLVPEGNVGVVVALDVGQARPATLEPGTHAINPWFARVSTIPTRELLLEWTEHSAVREDGLDHALKPIAVVIQGYRLTLELAQTIRIPASAAPEIVRRFGDGERAEPRSAGRAAVQRFVGRVLGATVDGFFAEAVGAYQIIDFILGISEVRSRLESRIGEALTPWGVVAGETTVGEPVAHEPEVVDLQRTLAGRNVELIREIRRQERQSPAVSIVHMEAEVARLATQTQGEREVERLRREIELAGPYRAAVERVVEQMGSLRVPQVVGGDAAERMLSVMPLAQAREMLRVLVKTYADD